MSSSISYTFAELNNKQIEYFQLSLITLIIYPIHLYSENPEAKAPPLL